jgi:hypothetical protein
MYTLILLLYFPVLSCVWSPKKHIKWDIGFFMSVFIVRLTSAFLLMCLFITLLDCFYLSTDLFVCVEVDSYGHYFRKAKSKLVCNSANPRWNEQFVIELEGSQNLRILLYEESQDRAILRAKFTQKVCNCIHSHDRVLIPMCKLHTSRIFL